jgi:hypothetical protein
MPKEVAALPISEIFGVALPAGWFSDEFDTAAVIFDTKPVSPDLVGFGAWTKMDQSTLRIELGATGGFVAMFDLQWGPAGGEFSVIQQSGPTVQLRVRGEIAAFADYLKECPPTVFLADGSELEGGLLKSPRDSLAQPRVVMEAMRHSDLKLTMKTYMDAQQLQGPVAAAVARLPWHREQSAQGIA